MVLRIDHPDAKRLAQELAALTGESTDDATVKALRQRLERVRSRLAVRAELANLVADVATYPVLDAMAQDQIIGYDSDGLPS